MFVHNAKNRKRAAVDELRNLAEALGLEVDRNRSELNKADFDAFYVAVTAACHAPDQVQTAQNSLKKYKGQSDEASSSVPVLPPISIASATPAPSTPATGAPARMPCDPEEGFRLRCSSCLFTYNNATFSNEVQEVLWQSFLVFVAALSCVQTWTVPLLV